MKLPFVFVSLRSVTRELRAVRVASERIAAALERAWPPVDLSGEPPDEQDFITAADHEPDEQALRQRMAQLVAQGREAELEELMTSALGGDE